jgi:FMN phosphatase YigB (HAD superfamily)
MQKFQDLGLVSLKDKLQLDFPYLSKSNIDELIFAWDNVLVPNTYVLDKISQLNCNFALLSNVGLEHAEFIKNTLGNYPCLKNSEMHLSCYVGARKPTKLFFQSFLFDKPNQHWYFMDDINNNVNMAAKVGFTAFQFDLKSPSWKNDFDKIFDLLKG